MDADELGALDVHLAELGHVGGAEERRRPGTWPRSRHRGRGVDVGMGAALVLRFQRRS